MARGLGGGPGGFGRMRFDEETAEKPKITKSMLIRIMKYFKPFWKQMILAVVAIFISSLLGLVPPVIIKDIVDIALPQKDLHLLITLIVISIGTTILLQLLQVGQSFLKYLDSQAYYF